LPLRLERKQLIPIAIWLCLLTAYYAFVVTAGTFARMREPTDYYDLLAQGWYRGQLNLPIEPRPSLLRRDDPFDYAYMDDWLWDASLYKGHYYLYWGPVPGLWLLVLKLITHYEGTLYDQWLVLAFMCLRLYAGAALIALYVRRQAPEVPSWAIQLAILVFGLANPTPYFIARPLIYEAAIAAGQAFVFCGLLAAYVGLLAPLTRTRSFVIAGICFAMALGSRGSLIVVAPLLVVVTALAAHRSSGYPMPAVIRSLVALGLPVVGTLGMLLVYNKLRFDSFGEFGLKYQLTGTPFTSESRFIVPNIVSYLTGELDLSCKFPFVRLSMTRELTKLIHWPDDYDLGTWDKGERAGGILLATSFCWLWCGWLWRTARGAWSALARLRDRERAPTGELWLLGSAIALTLSLGPATRMWMANQRFLEDAIGGILLGGIGAGIWMLKRSQRSEHAASRVLATSLFVVLSLHTIVTGACLGFTGHMDNFGNENPALFEKLKAKLSLCE
jgi:hypothetical protein